MALNDYWNDAADKAKDFLNTGTFSDVVKNAPLNNDIVDLDGGSNLNDQGGCTSTSQCPAGYACVNGRCKSTWQGPTGGTSGGQWNSAGECDQDDPNSPCNKGGPGGCQSRPTCGDGDPLQPRPEDCCDQKRCCSYGSLSSSRSGISCFCGDCPQLKKCSSFCAGYEAANGETGPGCSSGDNGNSCNQCTYCFAGECLPKETNKPCWCSGGEECSESKGPCYHCETDPEEPNFGGCVYQEANCKECSTLTNHRCSCNKILRPITICKPLSEGGKSASTLVREEAARICAEECKTDPCADVEGLKVNRCCFEDYGDCTFPSCSSPGTEGSTQIASTVDENGYGCVTCQYPPNLPEECKDCDCNCHDDCKDCEICSQAGVCEPDPECEVCPEGQKVCQDLETCCHEHETCIPVYENVFQVTDDGVTDVYRSVGAPADWYIRPADGSTVDCSDKNVSRDTLMIANGLVGFTSACAHPEGEERSFAYRDSQCFGEGTNRPDLNSFEPVLLESYIAYITCCDLSS